jgi:hypothetical protein
MTAADRPAITGRNTMTTPPSLKPFTYGEVAYEAFYAGTELGTPVPWEQLTDWDEHWNRAAKAVRETVSRQLAALLAKWEAEAADAKPRTEARKAAVRQKRICIRQLRQAIKGEPK